MVSWESLVSRNCTPGPKKGGYRELTAERILAPLYAQTSFYLPHEIRRSGKLPKAAIVLSAAVEIAPKVASGWYDLACARALSGKQSCSDSVIVTTSNATPIWRRFGVRQGIER